MTLAKNHILIGGRKQKNPLLNATKMASIGKEAFSRYCVACQRMNRQNTGAPFAEHISPPIPSLASTGVQSYTDE